MHHQVEKKSATLQIAQPHAVFETPDKTHVLHSCISENNALKKELVVLDSKYVIQVRDLETGALKRETKPFGSRAEEQIISIFAARNLIYCQQLTQTIVLDAKSLERKATLKDSRMSNALLLPHDVSWNETLLLCANHTGDVLTVSKVDQEGNHDWGTMYASSHPTFRVISSFAYLSSTNRLALGLNGNLVELCTFTANEVDPVNRWRISTQLRKSNFIAPLMDDHIAVACKENNKFVVNVIDLKNPKKITEFEIPNGTVQFMQSIMNGEALIFGQLNPGILQVWDFKTDTMQTIFINEHLDNIHWSHGFVTCTVENETIVYEMQSMLPFRNQLVANCFLTPQLADLTLQYHGLYKAKRIVDHPQTIENEFQLR
jgi:hypothetical protein